MEDVVKKVYFPDGKKKKKEYTLIIHNPNTKEDFDKFYADWIADVLEIIYKNNYSND